MSETTQEPRQDTRRWWQTMPGLLSAIAGVITAVTGLVVAITQLTGGGEDKHTAATGARATQIAASGTSTTLAAGDSAYRISFPAGAKATVASATYQVLAARAVTRNPGELALSLTVRMTNAGSFPANFWDASFRLDVDGVSRAPTSNLDEVVDARASKDGEIDFVVPASAHALTLVVGDHGEVRVPVRLERA